MRFKRNPSHASMLLSYQHVLSWYGIHFCCLFLLSSPNCYAFANQLQSHVDYLSSYALEGRSFGSRGEQLATQYAADYLRQYNLEPARNNGSYFQEFNAAHKHSRNVIARLSADTAAPVIIIGAHIDHLGRGELHASLARNDEANTIHPGADDNASGVASLLEAAAELSGMKATGTLKFKHTILFVLWSGEENGLLGSSYFIKHVATKIDAYINLDMVGRLQKNLVVQGVGSSAMWPQLIANANQTHELAILKQNDPYLPTDSLSFYLHGIPSINLFTGSHAEYHTPRDTSATLNYVGMAKITKFLVNLIVTLERNPTDLAFQQVQKTADHVRRNFKIFLGTIPDYTSADISGVKLSGVSSGSPAEHAGLKQNDIIIKLAGKNITDIYTYTRVLNRLQANIPVKMLVQRNQEKVALTIVPLPR